MIVECAVYDEGTRRPGELPPEHACEASQEPGTVVWIDLYEPSEDEFSTIRDELGLHPLAIEDALEAHQRPKIERYGDQTFIVLKSARYIDETEDVEFGEVMIFVGEAYLVTVRHADHTDMAAVHRRVDDDEPKVRHGPAGLVHALLDTIVDDYGPVVDGLQQDIDEAEESLFSSNGTSSMRVYKLGREVLEFSRAVQPLVEPLQELTDSSLGMPDELRSYFRDVQDHLARVDGWITSHRDLLNNLLQANLTQVTIVQNSDMRKISAWVAIAAVPTMVAGIYGMNFEHMPELRWTLGYPAVLVLIASACLVLYTRFKKSGWL